MLCTLHEVELFLRACCFIGLLLTLKMEAMHSSEISMNFYKTILQHISDVSSELCETLEFNKILCATRSIVIMKVGMFGLVNI
jgi:hypothetical protein